MNWWQMIDDLMWLGKTTRLANQSFGVQHTVGMAMTNKAVKLSKANKLRNATEKSAFKQELIRYVQEILRVWGLQDETRWNLYYVRLYKEQRYNERQENHR